MAASTFRFVIIVALVVGGIVVINQAFPSAPSGTTSPIDGGQVGPSTTTTTTPPPTETTRPPRTPAVEGVRIAIFNGTEVIGLAADTLAALIDEFGYVQAQEPADAPSPVPVTTIYFRRTRDRIEAEFLRDNFFQELENVRVSRLEEGADVDPDAQLAIYLGNDYATIRGQ